MQVPPCSIQWKGRQPVGGFQKGCGFMGLVMILLQVCISITIIAGKNAIHDPIGAQNNACPSGWEVYGHEYCMHKDLIEDIQKQECESQRPEWGPRSLAGEVYGNEDLMLDELMLEQSHRFAFRRLTETDDTMFDQFSNFPHIPGVLVPMMIFCGMLWITVMQRCAKTCIYGAIVLGVALLVFMSIFPTLITISICRSPAEPDFTVSNDSAGTRQCVEKGGFVQEKSGSVLPVFLVFAVVIIVATFCVRKKINVAAVCLSKCCLSLQERPMTIGASLGVFASFAFYLGMWIGFGLNLLRTHEPKCIGGLKSHAPKDNETLLKIMGILMVPTYIYFEMMVTVVVACGVGGWYFQDGEGIPRQPAIEGLKWAYSTSTGATFLSTIITWPIVEIRNYVHGKWAKFAFCPCLPCSWVYYIFYILWCCVLRAYLAFTKFMLISHTFHGGDVFGTAKNAWAVLKKHLGGAVVTDTIATYVLEMGVWILSVGFTLIAWEWMEYNVGKGVLSDLFSSTSNEAGTLVTVIFLLLGVSWCCHHSLFTIIAISFVSPYITKSHFEYADNFYGVLAGLFVGAISNIIFSFLAKIIGSGMDTIFYCFALESEHALMQARPGVAEIHDMIKDNIVTPLPDYLAKEKAVMSGNQFNSQNLPVSSVKEV